MTVFHSIGEFLRHSLDQVPLSVARWLMIGVYLLLMFWIVQLPSTQTNPNGRPTRWFNDLKVWAWVTLMLQIVIYSVF